MPARSSASQVVSSSSRCCGSMASASRGRDAEEPRVEIGSVGQEAAGAGVAGARVVGVGGEQRVQVPAAVGREGRTRVGTGRHQSPQVLRRAHAAGKAAAHPDDRDRVVHDDRGGRIGRGDRLIQQAFPQVSGEPPERRVVVDDRRGQPQAGRGTQPPTEVDGGQRAEAELLERADRVRRRPVTGARARPRPDRAPNPAALARARPRSARRAAAAARSHRRRPALRRGHGAPAPARRSAGAPWPSRTSRRTAASSRWRRSPCARRAPAPGAARPAPIRAPW